MRRVVKLLKTDAQGRISVYTFAKEVKSWALLLDDETGELSLRPANQDQELNFETYGKTEKKTLSPYHERALREVIEFMQQQGK